MTREDIKKMEVTVSKTVTFSLEKYLSDDPYVELDNYIDTLVSDLEYEYKKELSDISEEDVIDYISHNIFNEDNMEEILSDYYPEIDIKIQ